MDLTVIVLLPVPTETPPSFSLPNLRRVLFISKVRKEKTMFIRFVYVICLLVVSPLITVGQDVPKVEVFGGYSWAGGNFHGFDTSVTGNINRWFGLTADFSGHYGSEREGPILINKNAHTVQFGPRIS